MNKAKKDESPNIAIAPGGDDAEELAEWRAMFQAFVTEGLRAIAPDKFEPLWPCPWRQDVAMVAYALHRRPLPAAGNAAQPIGWDHAPPGYVQSPVTGAIGREHRPHCNCQPELCKGAAGCRWAAMRALGWQQPSPPPDPPAAGDRYSAGVQACIDWVEKRRHDFETEYGMIDPSTNAMEFRNTAREEYDCELVEIEEGLRALLAAQEAAK